MATRLEWPRRATTGANADRRRAGLYALLTAISLYMAGSIVGSRTELAAQEAEEAVDTRVVASVNGQPIYEIEIARELQKVPGKDSAAGSAAPLRSAVLEHVIDRLLVLEALQASGRAASQQEIDLEFDRLKQRVEKQGESLGEYLRKRDLNEPLLRRTIAWRLSWQRYLDQYLTEENLQRYFSKHRRDFDGTQMRVAHILWKVIDTDDPVELRRVKQLAAEVRKRVTGGEVTFAESARQHSAAPTADSGGDVGFIERGQPMSEAFSRAAFALDEGQLSEPVVTPAGVHLIQCLEIKPGTRTLEQTREELHKAASRYLFQWLAKRARTQAQIQIEDQVTPEILTQ